MNHNLRFIRGIFVKGNPIFFLVLSGDILCVGEKALPDYSLALSLSRSRTQTITERMIKRELLVSLTLMYRRGLKAIIFDMDGVLVDSEPLHLLAMQDFLGRYGISYGEEENREFLGRKDIVIAEILIDRYKLPDMNPLKFVDFKEEILKELIQTRALARPGVYDLLARARKINVPMAVASSATLPTINLVVDTLKIRENFLTLCSGDQVQNGKPAPDIYLLAARQISVAPENCLVIEDTITGLTAGKSAGMFCISIPCEATAHQDHSIANMSLASIDQLPVEEIFGYNSHSAGN